MRVKMVEYADCNPEQKAAYDGQIAKHGKITNMKKTLLNHLPSFNILMEWYDLRDMIVELVGEFSTNVYAYAISAENDCLICSTFFRRIIKDAGFDPDDLKLDDKTQLLMDYGRACVGKAYVSDELFAKMKAEFTDEQIVLLTTFAGQMIATNLINTALKVPLDEYLVAYTKR